MTWKLQAAIAAVFIVTLGGCQSSPKVSEVEDQVIRGQGESYYGESQWSYPQGNSPQGTYYENNNRYSGSACDDDGSDVNCGLLGVAKGFCCESWALFNVMFAYRWEGGYPDGPLHGWRGSWCGPFGEGSADTTPSPCIPPGAY
jgi:hypothetical protein